MQERGLQEKHSKNAEWKIGDSYTQEGVVKILGRQMEDLIEWMRLKMWFDNVVQKSRKKKCWRQRIMPGNSAFWRNSNGKGSKAIIKYSCLDLDIVLPYQHLFYIHYVLGFWGCRNNSTNLRNSKLNRYIKTDNIEYD